MRAKPQAAFVVSLLRGLGDSSRADSAGTLRSVALGVDVVWVWLVGLFNVVASAGVIHGLWSGSSLVVRVFAPWVSSNRFPNQTEPVASRFRRRNCPVYRRVAVLCLRPEVTVMQQTEVADDDLSDMVIEHAAPTMPTPESLCDSADTALGAGQAVDALHELQRLQPNQIKRPRTGGAGAGKPLTIVGDSDESELLGPIDWPKFGDDCGCDGPRQG